MHARADVNNMSDWATKPSNISPTFLRNFLSPEEVDILFLNDLDEEFVLFSVICIFFLAQISENCGLLRTHGSSLSMRWLQGPFPDNFHNIGAIY